MAVAEELTLNTPAEPFLQSALGKNFLRGLAVAAVLAIVLALWMWNQQPQYRVLFANFTDRDGGAITGALDQMNIQHKFAEGGGAILVPADQVHDARLKLAAQGLPKGGNVGFELMENQKLGVSQFLEQVNFQRALEGELARSVESLAAVNTVRVHLALPKPSVFVREQQKPTASVLLNLHPGRAIDPGQVSAIVHLVASSVPELLPSNVTVVDQAGTLLSDTSKKSAAGNAKNLDPNQLKYVQQLQESVVSRVESIISAIVGVGNVRAEATADVDFSQIEQAAETYKPNSPPAASTMRSQQSSEAGGASQGAAGVPGALSNQPPGAAGAPLTVPPGTAAAPGAAAASGAAATPGAPTRKDSTINYEVDKTVRYEQTGMGGLRRLSVAVAVNYRRTVDKAGKVSVKPLSAAEVAQIDNLVKEAMGYNKDRGDSYSVVNSPFSGVDKPVDVAETIPLWRDPVYLALAKDIGKFLITALILLYLYMKVVRPMMRPVLRKIEEVSAPPPGTEVLHSKGGKHADEEPVAEIVPPTDEDEAQRVYEENLEMARNLAKADPRIVANVIKSWVGPQ
jgi:flagellar M-ring protein FliF